MELTTFLQDIDAVMPEAEKEKRLQQLTQYINMLIATDFNQLVQLLYTVDVAEQKLKRLLQEQSGQDAAPLIARLLWERAEEKARSRRQFSQPPPQDDAERW
jgi:hypothetical protein